MRVTGRFFQAEDDRQLIHAPHTVELRQRSAFTAAAHNAPRSSERSRRIGCAHWAHSSDGGRAAAGYSSRTQVRHAHRNATKGGLLCPLGTRCKGGQRLGRYHWPHSFRAGATMNRVSMSTIFKIGQCRSRAGVVQSDAKGCFKGPLLLE